MSKPRPRCSNHLVPGDTTDKGLQSPCLTTGHVAWGESPVIFPEKLRLTEITTEGRVLSTLTNIELPQGIFMFFSA